MTHLRQWKRLGRVMVECTLSITHCLRLNLQLYTIDLVRTCHISSFCTVAWQLARFQLTRCITWSLGDSWASCTFFLTPNYSVKALIQTHGLTCSLHQPPSDSWVKALCSLYAGSPTPLHVTCCMKSNPQTSKSDNNKWQKFKRTASWYHVSAGVETEINRVTVDKTNYYQVKYLRIMSVNFTR